MTGTSDDRKSTTMARVAATMARVDATLAAPRPPAELRWVTEPEPERPAPAPKAPKAKGEPAATRSALNAAVEGIITGTSRAIRDVRKEATDRIAALEARVTATETRLATIETRLAALEAQLGKGV